MGIFEMGQSGTRPAMTAYATTPTYRASYINNSGTQVNGDYSSSGIVWGDDVEVRQTLSATGVVQANLSRNAGAEGNGTASGTNPVPTGTTWGASTFKPNYWNAVGVGYMLLRSVRFSVGSPTLAQLQAS